MKTAIAVDSKLRDVVFVKNEYNTLTLETSCRIPYQGVYSLFKILHLTQKKVKKQKLPNKVFNFFNG